MITLHHGDCLEVMKDIESGSIDLILCDLPYGTTNCKWDTIIPFEPLWEQYKRIIKPNGAIVLFGSQPFTSALVMSNPKWFKYDWVWDKIKPNGHLIAKIRPMQRTETISVFCEGRSLYKPIMTPRSSAKTSKEYSKSEITGFNTCESGTRILTEKYPQNVLVYSNASQKNRFHPTQKPVALLEYLIKTYTNEGETVLDNCMGSGSTGVACMNTNRKFIGIEKDETYFKLASERIQSANITPKLPTTTL